MERYYLGMDLGTNSVGFAVTDENYNVIKKFGKYLIGARVFEEGNTAAKRRGYRSSRRRQRRRKDRTKYLQQLFGSEICKVDKSFFMRLKESAYHYEDRGIQQVYSLFNDEGYTDVEYHDEYPTIYHLRKALMTKSIQDPRLLYLAIDHIIKHRGHFLFEGKEIGSISDFNDIFNDFTNYIEENYENLVLDISDIKQLENILKNRNFTSSEKEKEVKKICRTKPTSQQNFLIKLIVGGSVDVVKMLNLDVEEKISVSFKSDTDEAYQSSLDMLDEHVLLIEYAKAIYDWGILVSLINIPGSTGKEITISDAKIYWYEMHKAELRLLKKMVKTYAPTMYKTAFEVDNIENNYVSYVGKSRSNNKKKIIGVEKCTQEDVCSYFLKLLSNVNTTDEHELELIRKLELKTLLPKQRTKENGVLPYQLHQKELREILKNSSSNFPFLNEIINGKTVAKMIEELLVYRIPYYVGPLNRNSPFAWVERSSDKVTPWNFNEVVDLEKSAENFIFRMTNKCTYLRENDVLPKHSILYSKFMVLNEINNLKVNGEPISEVLKKELYENLFKNFKQVKTNKIKDYLIRNAHADRGEVEITGINKECKSSLDSYITFKKIFGDVENNIEMIEDIILWVVLFSNDKAMLKSKIMTKYKERVSEEQFNKIKSLNYSGWGRLSKELLEGIQMINPETGEILSIIDALYHTNNNLMQLLSDKYKYLDEIKKCNKKEESMTITKEVINDLYCSPAVKKSIHQAIKIVKEIERVMGGKPEKVFIEVTRSEGEKRETKSRHKQLTELYKSICKDLIEYDDVKKELEEKNEARLRQKKLYLYFTQLGRSVYSGKKIDLNTLLSTNTYDIEHIYPRSKTKDDSIHNNLVLVEKSINANKSDVFPIPEQYRQRKLWLLLRDRELISEEKYKRLSRVTEFAPEELKGFINRQLVETSQSSKAVAELLENYYSNSNTTVVYTKAGNVSDFRHHFDIYKIRSINDLHHAHDAYLNVVVGNVFHSKFTQMFFMNIETQKYNLRPEKLYGFDIEKNGKKIWLVNNTISVVKKNLALKRMLFTRQSNETSGKFYNETIYGAGNADIARKTSANNPLSNCVKYGGYKSINGAYFCIVKHTVKKKSELSIESIPVFLAKDIKKNPKVLSDYLRDCCGLNIEEVLVEKLRYNSLIKLNNVPFHISGKSDGRIGLKCASQLLVPIKSEEYFKILESANLKQKSIPGYTNKKITKEKNLDIYDFYIEKLNEKVYYEKLGKMRENLIKLKGNFVELSLMKQVEALINLLALFQCNATKADLSLIKGASQAGNIRMSKKLNKLNDFRIINQSVTGIFEEEIVVIKK